MPAPFRIYNTLTREVEPYTPSEPGLVRVYVCGMTVYDHSHVGHFRAMVVFDTVVRWLRHRGWNVRYVRNFTDVDDKIIRRANEQGVPAAEVAERYITSFQDDCARLGLIPPDAEPRVSTSMGTIQAMIAELIEAGHAYEAGGSVWFSVRTFPEYGKLSNQDVDAHRTSGEGDGVKREPLDFALWKAAKPGEPAWPSPWGDGRPGWHIECSAMNRECHGATIDIHGGGLDLVFPHHENEIAQSECANHAPYARYWMHNGMLTVAREADDGSSTVAKMGKSLGNAYAMHKVLDGFPAEAIRLYYLQAHYRSPLPWQENALPEALAMLARLYEAREVAEGWGGTSSAEEAAEALAPAGAEVLELARALPARIAEAMDEDFNTAAALGRAFELARAINRLGNHKKARSKAGPIGAVAIRALSELHALGLLTGTSAEFQEEVKAKRLGAMGVDPARVDDLLAQRHAARDAKRWADADAIRAELDAMGVVVMDGADGVRWRVRLTEPNA